jgi:hypothetical protein
MVWPVLLGVCPVRHPVADIADGLQSVNGCCGPWMGDSTAVSKCEEPRGWVTALLFRNVRSPVDG